MVYLDYSATTPVNKEVLKSFNDTCLNFPGNPNSLHKLGFMAKKEQENATEELATMLGVLPSEIIYTSGASESNNLAFKGIALKYQNRGKHIITTMLEHASIFGPAGYLQELGFEVDFAPLNNQGEVDLEELKKLIRNDTILVSVAAVDSELGVIQPIKEIAGIIKCNPKCFFHVDMTQAVGKMKVDLTDIHLASLSAHKFYGLKGIGVLVKKEKVMLEPLIHGGKSTTAFRSGTPALPLIVSLIKALSLINPKMTENLEYVQSLNQDLREFLKGFSNVIINSPEHALPYVLNFSLKGVKAETFVHALESDEVYISTKSACSSSDTISKAVLAVTNDPEAASSSLRISLSKLTTTEEINHFKKSFTKHYRHLVDEK